MSTEPNQPPAQLWAIVELMGHQRLAGRLSEHTLAGASFIRIDVPAMQRPDGTERQPQTFIQSPSSIYRVRIVDEAAARFAATSLDIEPFSEYSLARRIEELNQAATSRAIRHDTDDTDDDDYE